MCWKTLFPSAWLKLFEICTRLSHMWACTSLFPSISLSMVGAFTHFQKTPNEYSQVVWFWKCLDLLSSGHNNLVFIKLIQIFLAHNCNFQHIKTKYSRLAYMYIYMSCAIITRHVNDHNVLAHQYVNVCTLYIYI